MGNSKDRKVMAKEVSALNTYWLLQYLAEYYPSLDLQSLVSRIAQMFPCYIENLQTGRVEQVSLAHLQTPRYWFSHHFVKTLHDLVQEHIPDPRLGYKIGSTLYKTQPVLKTALGIPLLGTHGVARRVSREAAKYNRTKQYHVQQLAKGVVDIRITHDPGIVVNEFSMQWNAGCFASYARMAGATDISVDLRCIEPGPEHLDDSRRAIWDFELRYQEPGLFTRLSKAALSKVPWIKNLTERAEAVEEEHQEQILNRDNIIRERTSDLAIANETMRAEISERKLAEKALLQSQGQLQRYITAIDDIGLGLCVIDADYRLRVMNKTLIGWLGDHHGNSCFSTIMGQAGPCPQCQLTDVIEQGKKVRYQPTLADGRTFEIVATPISNRDGSISKMEIIRDITEQKAEEERRLERSRQKEQLKKLASLKTMAGAIAHRFNNAMTGVQGNLELMTLSLPGDSDECRMAATALQAAKGASRVGTMMLSYVGQNPLQVEETPLADLVLESVTALKNNFQPSLSLEFIPPEQPLYCSIDPLQIKEVIENIVMNAVESLADGSGKIEISFGLDYFTTDIFPLFFQGSHLKDGFYAYCQIKDSGHGVSPEDLQQIFEPFYTTRFVGRGLGLALAAGIIQTHRGAITIESRLQKGTVVRVLLPSLSLLAEEKVGSFAAVKDEAVPLSGHILLADDEPVVLIVVKMMIEHLGFTVHTAVNGREAINTFRRQDVPFCAVVLDVLMPELDGVEAMKEIRKIDPAVPVLLISGFSKDEIPFPEDQENRPDAFMVKPVQRTDMRRQLEKLLARC
ncbi:MAG: response regulator [Proteobacteria bacterium]|nr:response regulator [Pseudomonadota bacterium]MBU1059214.1 response regulator [Pseudomonadota bacterium]